MKPSLPWPLISEVILTLGGVHVGYWDSMDMLWGFYKDESRRLSTKSLRGVCVCVCVCG